jgi:hypothetical protein
MFEHWLTDRGGKHAMEDRIDEDVLSYLMQYEARLQEVTLNSYGGLTTKKQMDGHKIPNSLGYIHDNNGEQRTDYYIRGILFKTDICKSIGIGMDVAKAELIRKGILQPGNDGTGNTRWTIDKKQLRMMVLSYPHSPDSYSN